MWLSSTASRRRSYQSADEISAPGIGTLRPGIVAQVTAPHLLRHTSMPGRLFLGTSGWVYPHWRRRLYPPDLPMREWLPFYARHFATVELNNPFYRLPAKVAFERWRALVPDHF